MSDKYIIRNCPTLMGNRLCYGKEIRQCADCTGCVMKQIYKLCKDDYTQFGDKELRYDTLEEIIEILDIQEVE